MKDFQTKGLDKDKEGNKLTLRLRVFARDKKRIFSKPFIPRGRFPSGIKNRSKSKKDTNS